MYIRCQKCGKILAEMTGQTRIEIRNGKRRAVINGGNVDIICDRCGTQNLILQPARIRRHKAMQNPAQLRLPV